MARLTASLHIGDLTNRVTLDIAKDMLTRLARDRIARNDISKAEESLLKLVVKYERVAPSELANELGKSVQYVAKVLNKLLVANLDARLAYTEDLK